MKNGKITELQGNVICVQGNFLENMTNLPLAGMTCCVTSHIAQNPAVIP
jgi:hypothetical protein